MTEQEMECTGLPPSRAAAALSEIAGGSTAVHRPLVPEERPWASTFFVPVVVQKLRKKALYLFGSELGEDVLQETLKSLYRSRFLDVENPNAYAHRVLVREGARLKRQADRLREGDRYASLMDPGSATDPGFAPITDSDFIEDVLADLPPKQRQVMTMYFNLSTPTEIATELGVPLTNVTSNLALARQALRNHPLVVAELCRSDPPPSSVPQATRERHLSAATTSRASVLASFREARPL